MNNVRTQLNTVRVELVMSIGMTAMAMWIAASQPGSAFVIPVLGGAMTFSVRALYHAFARGSVAKRSIDASAS